MIYFVIISWILVGLSGASLIFVAQRLDAVSHNLEQANFCPSPSNIVAILITSCMGFSIFIAGIVIFWTGYSIDHPNPNGWWSRPICSKRKEP